MINNKSKNTYRLLDPQIRRQKRKGQNGQHHRVSPPSNFPFFFFSLFQFCFFRLPRSVSATETFVPPFHRADWLRVATVTYSHLTTFGENRKTFVSILMWSVATNWFETFFQDSSLLIFVLLRKVRWLNDLFFNPALPQNIKMMNSGTVLLASLHIGSNCKDDIRN